MCEMSDEKPRPGLKKLSIREAVGTVLAHDITEIRPDEFKGPAFRKGHIIREDDVCHLRRLGKENIFVVNIAEDEMHEDDAAYALAKALMGKGVGIKGEPKEGKITIVAETDGLLKINEDALLAFNMLGDIMCATLHSNTVVRRDEAVAGTRAIPLIVKKAVVDAGVRIAEQSGGIVSVSEMRKPAVGVVITGNEIYYGRVKDAFAPVIARKIKAIDGRIIGIYYAPDDESFIESRLRELISAGADMLITTGGMSVDPDDVTRFAIKRLGAAEVIYGSAVLPGAMVLVAYVDKAEGAQGIVPDGTNAPCTLPDTSIPILGIPACGMYHATTVFDLILPRLLAGERIERRDLADLGHGGLCLGCNECRYPVCPFGK